MEDAVLLLQHERSLITDVRNGSVSVTINNSTVELLFSFSFILSHYQIQAISNIEKQNETYMEGQRQLAKQQKDLQQQAEQVRFNFHSFLIYLFHPIHLANMLFIYFIIGYKQGSYSETSSRYMVAATCSVCCALGHSRGSFYGRVLK